MPCECAPSTGFWVVCYPPQKKAWKGYNETYCCNACKRQFFRNQKELKWREAQ